MAAAAAFEIVDRAGSKTLVVRGEIDLANAGEFRSFVLSEGDKPRVEAVDLTHCTYMDSTGLGVLVLLQKRLERPVRVSITSSSMLNRLLQITGLDRSFDVVRQTESTREHENGSTR